RTGVIHLPRTYVRNVSFGQHAPSSGGYYRDTQAETSTADRNQQTGNGHTGNRQTGNGHTGNRQAAYGRRTGWYYPRDIPPSGLPPPSQVSRQPIPGQSVTREAGNRNDTDADCEEIELTLTGLRRVAGRTRQHR